MSTLLVVCEVEALPDEFRPTNGGDAIFAYRLSGAIKVDEEERLPESPDAFIKDICEAWEKVDHFNVYQVTIANGALTLAFRERVSRDKSHIDDNVQASFLTWLTDDKASADFLWTASGNEDETSADRVKVWQSALAASTWPAPIPQQIGVCGWFPLADLDRTMSYVCIPCFDGDEGTWEVSTFVPGDGTIPKDLELRLWAKDRTIVRYTQTTVITDNGVREKSAFLIPPTFDLVPALDFAKRFTGSAGDTLLVWSAFREINADVLQVTDGNKIDRLTWFAQTCFVCAFDPLVTVLMRSYGKDGEIMTAFAAAIDEALDAQDDGSPGPTNDPEIAVLKSALRKMLGEQQSATGATWTDADFTKSLLPMVLNSPSLALAGAAFTAFDTAESLKANAVVLRKDLNSRDSKDSIAAIIADIELIYAALQAENAVEGFIVELLVRSKDDQPAAIQNVLPQALRTFAEWLSQRFNAADAIDKGYAKALLDGLTLTEFKGKDGQTIEEFAKTKLDDLAIFTKRVANATGLPSIDVPADIKGPLIEFLNQQYKVAITSICEETKRSRFVPTAAAESLPIALWDSDSTVAEWSGGVAVLIRNSNRNTPWAYTHLADLEKPDVIGEMKWLGTIRAERLVEYDGRRQLHFEYGGVPRNARDIGGPADDADQWPAVTPFYQVDSHTFQDNDDFAKLPPLAYGISYDYVTFQVSVGGLLPRYLQATETEPWKPKLTITDDDVGNDHRKNAPYWRRTVVGSPSWREEVPAGTPQRLGFIGAAVRPLWFDRKRKGFMKAGQSVTYLDLCRTPDGAGLLKITNGAFTTVTLRDLWCWTNEAEGMVSIHCMSSVDGTPSGSFRFTQGIKEKLTIGLGTLDPPANGYDILIQVPVGEEYWLRFECTSDGAVSLDERCAIIESDGADKTPVASGGPDKANILLLAPADPAKWNAPYRDSVKLKIITPRTNFLVFERWLANPELLAKCCEDDNNQKDQQQKALRELINILWLAYNNRSQDPQDRSDARNAAGAIATLLEQLPDPAVDVILITAQPLDDMNSAASRAPIAFPTPIKKLGAAALNLKKTYWDKNNFQLKEWASNPVATNDIPPDLQHLARIIKALNDVYVVKYKIEHGDQLSVSENTCTTPAGSIVAVNAHGLVKKSLLTNILDPRFLECVVGDHDDHWVMPGHGLVVETMSDALQPLTVRDAVTCEQVGARSYDLVLDPKSDSKWRWYGFADVTTQRWRFLGRPIYSWFDPYTTKRRDQEKNPSLWEVNNSNDQVRSFETEAFLGRGDDDAITGTPVTLKCAPEPTVLHHEDWNYDSATYYRHRATFRSRYWGALTSPDGNGALHIPENENKGTWLGVAVLATGKWDHLAPPQLRSLLPLTRRIAPDRDELAPPILAILQEPPFAYGGLAERIDAEIKVGVNYKYNDQGQTVQPEGLYFELGPRPTQTIFPTKSDDWPRFFLEAEGPVGLTFDTPDSAAPEFANTAFTLRPEVSQPALTKSLEEYFLTLSLRRHMDPRWVAGSREPNGQAENVSFDFKQRTWIAIDTIGVDVSVTVESIDVTSPVIAQLRQDGNDVLFEINKQAIERSGVPQFLPVVRHDTKSFSGYAMLHQPLSKTTASLGLFGKRSNTSTEKGHSNDFTLLATVTWSVPNSTAISSLKVTNASRITSVAASLPTQPETVPLSRDFGTVMVQQLEGAANDVRPVRVTALQARCEGENGAKTLRFLQNAKSVWLRPHGSDRKGPLYTQDHLAVLVTEVLPVGNGDIEWFSGAALLRGDKMLLQDLCPDCAGLNPRVVGSSFNLRLLSFRTPANIFTDAANPPDKRFKTAYFDVMAVTGSQPTDPCFVQLHMRWYGAPVQKGMTLKFSVTGQQVNGGLRTISLKSMNDNDWNDATLHALDIVLERSNGDTRPLRATGFLTDGRTVTYEVSADRALPNLFPGFWIALAGDPNVGERWVDASLFVYKKQRDPAALFDWLIPGSDNLQGSEPSDDVIDAMKQAREAQAQFLAMSEPIPIRLK